MTEREVVLGILTENEIKGTYSHILVKNALDRCASLPDTQRSFIKRLAEGTIERRSELDRIIDAHLTRRDIHLKPRVRCLLRMSIYQILYMDSVPDFAAVNEAVAMMKKDAKAAQAGFVNGLLRSVCRDKAAGRLKKDTTGEQSMPSWIVGMWKRDLGEETARQLLQSLLMVRPVCIRFVPSVSGEEQKHLEQKMQEQGISVLPGRYLSYCRLLQHVKSVKNLPGFAEGRITVQDESSMLAVEASGVRTLPDEGEGCTILDLCAAPGGKSTFLAALAPKARVISCDLSAAKTSLIRAAAGRLHLSNLTVLENDASQLRPEFENCADIVYCDVPCSGLGVATRKRDIKDHISREKIRSLTSLQMKIMRNAVRYVRPGGTLLYSTCTISRAENENMAAKIAKMPGMQPSDLTPYLPPDFPGIEDNHVQLLPSVHGTDGFFIARFTRQL